MARRVLRMAYWFGVAVAATTIATVVIAYSVGARPVVYGDDDVARYLANTDPVAGSPSRPASPGTARGGAGHAGGTGGVSGDTAPAPGGAAGAGTLPDAAPAAPGTAPNPDPGGGSNPPPSVTGILFSSGGSVVASCSGSVATLQTWTPKTGFHADDVAPGPAAQASLEFKSETAGDFLVVVTCPNGTPTLSEQVAAGHGGGPGKGSGGGGGGG